MLSKNQMFLRGLLVWWFSFFVLGSALMPLLEVDPGFWAEFPLPRAVIIALGALVLGVVGGFVHSADAGKAITGETHTTASKEMAVEGPRCNLPRTMPQGSGTMAREETGWDPTATRTKGQIGKAFFITAAIIALIQGVKLLREFELPVAVAILVTGITITSCLLVTRIVSRRATWSVLIPLVGVFYWLILARGMYDATDLADPHLICFVLSNSLMLLTSVGGAMFGGLIVHALSLLFRRRNRDRAEHSTANPVPILETQNSREQPTAAS